MDHIKILLNKNKKDKKATTNTINRKDNKFFQYAVTAALNHEEITKHPQRITNTKPFILTYSWKGINFPSKKVTKKNLRNII